MENALSLKQYLVSVVQNGEHLDHHLIDLLTDVASACEVIHEHVNFGGLRGGTLGAAATENVQGETQKKLDIKSNEWFIDKTQRSGNLAGMASEEEEDVYAIPAEYPKGPYLMYFDPLDGSSNMMLI